MFFNVVFYNRERGGSYLDMTKLINLFIHSIIFFSRGRMRESSSAINKPRLTNYCQVTHWVNELVLVWHFYNELEPVTATIKALAPSCCYTINSQNTHFARVKHHFCLLALCLTAELQSSWPNAQGVTELISRFTRQAAEYTKASRAHACKNARVCARSAYRRQVYQNAPIYSVRYTCDKRSRVRGRSQQVFPVTSVHEILPE